MEHKIVKLSDVRIHYVRAGMTEEAIVLLHGWPQTWYAWRKVIPLLAQHFTVIAPDLRGCGDSSRPPSGYNKKTVAQDVNQLIHHLGFNKVHIVGHDMGGAVAYAYCLSYPILSFTFIESNIPGFGIEDSMDIAKGGSWHFGFNMAGAISEALVQGRERLFLSHFFRERGVSIVDPTSILDHDIDEYVRTYAAPGGMAAGFNYYRTLKEDAEYNRANHLALKVPVLTVGAEYGYGEKPYKIMSPLAKSVRRVVIKDSGHYIPEERPEALAEEILRFCKASCWHRPYKKEVKNNIDKKLQVTGAPSPTWSHHPSRDGRAPSSAASYTVASCY